MTQTVVDISGFYKTLLETPQKTGLRFNLKSNNQRRYNGHRNYDQGNNENLSFMHR